MVYLVFLIVIIQIENLRQLLPVMVFIHGGGYDTGMNYEYPGYFLARNEVVIVVINYRLGVLGRFNRSCYCGNLPQIRYFR